jgi:protein-S-isoprenylcysteine O-methyltransferase Ste14
MLTVLRHMLSILLLPFMMVVVVPLALRSTLAGADLGWPAGVLLAWLARTAGAGLLAAGLLLFGWCVSLFARVGQGTLAPWDPTRWLVVVGPYRYLRNPMISGVAAMLVGEALVWGSWAQALWGLGFMAINHLYFVLLEEPDLEGRFGEAYRAYKGHVPRWLPRRQPCTGAAPTIQH